MHKLLIHLFLYKTNWENNSPNQNAHILQQNTKTIPNYSTPLFNVRNDTASDYAIHHVANRRLTAKARILFQASPRRICARTEWHWETFFFDYFGFPP
jgi:hypothetical protein